MRDGIKMGKCSFNTARGSKMTGTASGSQWTARINTTHCAAFVNAFRRMELYFDHDVEYIPQVVMLYI